MDWYGFLQMICITLAFACVRGGLEFFIFRRKQK